MNEDPGSGDVNRWKISPDGTLTGGPKRLRNHLEQPRETARSRPTLHSPDFLLQYPSVRVDTFPRNSRYRKTKYPVVRTIPMTHQTRPTLRP